MEKLKNKKILITGHTGFKGSWLSYTLFKIGAKIYGISLKPSKKINRNFFLLGLESKCINYFQDINNLKELNKTINQIRPEIIFHFAAQPLISESFEDPIKTFQTNVFGTQNLMECCRKNKFIKVIIISTTDKVYENNKIRNFKEEDKLNGDDPYSASKAATEILINSYSKSFLSDKKVATVRAGNVIGFGDYSKNRIIPDLIENIFSKKALFIRQLESYRPWHNILDVTLSYLKLCIYLNQKNINYSNWNFSPKFKKKFTVEEIIIKLSKISKKKIYYKQANTKKIFKEKKFLSLNSNKSIKTLKLKNQNIDQTLNQIYKLNDLYRNNKDVISLIDKLIERHVINEI